MLVRLEGLLKLSLDAGQDAVKYPLVSVTGKSRGFEDLDLVSGPDHAR